VLASICALQPEFALGYAAYPKEVGMTLTLPGLLVLIIIAAIAVLSAGRWGVERAADSWCPPPSGSSALCSDRGSRGSSTSPSPSFSV
jgi:hypothetical protein